MNNTYSKQISSAVDLQSCFVQLVLLHVRLDITKVFRPLGNAKLARIQGQKIRQTGKTEVSQSTFVSFKVVIDPEALVELV